MFFNCQVPFETCKFVFSSFNCHGLCSNRKLKIINDLRRSPIPIFMFSIVFQIVNFRLIIEQWKMEIDCEGSPVQLAIFIFHVFFSIFKLIKNVLERCISTFRTKGANQFVLVRLPSGLRSKMYSRNVYHFFEHKVLINLFWYVKVSELHLSALLIPSRPK